jgi:hypothetical protein
VLGRHSTFHLKYLSSIRKYACGARGVAWLLIDMIQTQGAAMNITRSFALAVAVLITVILFGAITA